MYRINPKVLQTPVTDGNILLLEPEKGLYYELNDTSVMIFQAIENGMDRDGIVRLIVSNYEIDEKTAQTDIDILISLLKDNNIIYY